MSSIFIVRVNYPPTLTVSKLTDLSVYSISGMDAICLFIVKTTVECNVIFLSWIKVHQDSKKTGHIFFIYEIYSQNVYIDYAV